MRVVINSSDDEEDCNILYEINLIVLDRNYLLALVIEIVQCAGSRSRFTSTKLLPASDSRDCSMAGPEFISSSLTFTKDAHISHPQIQRIDTSRSTIAQVWTASGEISLASPD